MSDDDDELLVGNDRLPESELLDRARNAGDHFIASRAGVLVVRDHVADLDLEDLVSVAVLFHDARLRPSSISRRSWANRISSSRDARGTRWTSSNASRFVS